MSISPHPQSEVSQQNSTFKQELMKLGELAYIGEQTIGKFSDKYRHFIAFWVLAILMDLAYRFKTSYKLIFLVSYGVFIEFVQYVIPYRDFDLFDILFNVFFVLLYFLFRRLFFQDVLKRIYLSFDNERELKA